MSDQHDSAPRPLPDRPNLRHLKDQAKDLLKSGAAESLTDAQLKVARSYGFASWTKLKSHIESIEEVGRLKQAIDANDLDRVKEMMTRNPALHRAPLGYAKAGPLTWVAECRVPREPPGAARLAMADWMIRNGSDVHQDRDAPLGRAALYDDRIPMMELLLTHGADVNAVWRGYSPVIFSPCETLAPGALKWLLDHGANPNWSKPGQRYTETALDAVIGTYVRSPQFTACIDILLTAGGQTRYDIPPVLDLLRDRLDRLEKHLDAEPAMVHRRFAQLDIGATGHRRLTLKGGTLLHVAAEYGSLEAARLLLDRGAEVNARASTDESVIDGQTPIFHAVTQFGDWGLPVARFLVERGADLTVIARMPGHYERPDETVECTPRGYAKLFPGAVQTETLNFLEQQGAP